MTMAAAVPHVLATDVTLVPVRDLQASVRALLQCDDDAFAVSRPSGRAGTKIIGAAAGELLGAFTEPRRITEVVGQFTPLQQADRRAYADSATGFLAQMINAGFLVEAGSAREEPARPMFTRADRVGAWEIVTCLHCLDDVDVYQVRDRRGRRAALKIARVHTAWVADLIRREAAILRALNGVAAPRFLAAGSLGKCPWFVSEWCEGADAETAALDIRSLPAPEQYNMMRDLIIGIGEAYCALHDRGIVHGDVHAKNIRVGAFGAVRLLDFGWSRRLARQERIARAGAGFLFEPEYASASLAHRRLPQATPRSEQYIVATMLDKLWTGAPAFDLSVRIDEAWRQIVEDEPLSFEARGVAAEPEIEGALRRAMRKRPAQRFPSMRHFANALRQASRPTENARTVRSRPFDFAGASDAILRRLRLTGGGLRDAVTRAPTCSLAAGAAGVAYTLRRIAIVRESAVPLAWANVWASRAESRMTLEHGLTADQPGLSSEEIGPISLLHAAPGVHFATALVSDALGEHTTSRRAVAAFVRAAAVPSSKTDLTHGRAGTLLGCAQLMELTAAGTASRRVRALGEDACRALWRSLAREPRVGDPASRIDLGAAHGWSGALFATLRWAQASGARVSKAATARLVELAACGEPFGRGLRWHLFIRGAPDLPRGRYVAGWCNGAAGLAQLWFLAAEVLGDARFLRLGVGSAWHAWESEVSSGPSVCCGDAGRAYAMLAAWRHTGDDAWLTRARSLAERALRGARAPSPADARPESLYFGDLGVALLAAELAVPSRARMPLLERSV